MSVIRALFIIDSTVDLNHTKITHKLYVVNKFIIFFPRSLENFILSI